MEDTHGATRPILNDFRVLILIIMEDTHGVAQELQTQGIVYCLNPYYNGRYSWRATVVPFT